MTGEHLVRRDDDQEDVVRNRLKTYHEQTEVLVSYYGKEAAGAASIAVDGTQGIDDVKKDILARLMSV